jgi:predicted nucleic acid-binding protein
VELLYLDYNCFQRGFDDPRQVRIQMEALACQEIFEMAEREKVQLVWSFMHEDETILCPFPARKQEAFRLSALCRVRTGPEDRIFELARAFREETSLSAKDAVHLACAVFIKAGFFVTCDDDGLVRRAKGLREALVVMNPVDYVRREVR